MITTPVDFSLLRGASEVETTDHGLRPHRLPAWARAQFPDPQLSMVEAQPSGVRSASAPVPPPSSSTSDHPRGLTPACVRPSGAYDLLVDGR